ncbi:uncharacterized protein LOC122060745 [Macadamia integrifolia]|uniref:uncharacterized protein LOC122060745 n=1 Tax=Macadamia integrifolia TaxID=60698 RepID=UPI001C52FEE6|nr:uncharacterized protein LOC122060745 [Macadamia integrifolia]
MGIFSVKSAWEGIRKAAPAVSWASLVWNKDLPSRLSTLAWCWAHGKLPADDKIQKKQIYLPSRSDLCGSSEESFNHLFLDCRYSSEMWDRAAVMLNVVWTNQPTVVDVIKWWKNKVRGWSLKRPWMIGLVVIIEAIWKERNGRCYEGKASCPSLVVNTAIKDVSFIYNGMKISPSSATDLVLAKRLLLSICPSSALSTLEVYWCKAPRPWVKLNVDGCSLGNPGRVGGGGIFGDHNGKMIFLFGFFMGIATNFQAEI